MQNVRLRRRTTHDVHSLKHYSPDIAQAIVVEPIALDAGYLPGSRSAFDVRQQKSERETAGRERAGQIPLQPREPIGEDGWEDSDQTGVRAREQSGSYGKPNGRPTEISLGDPIIRSRYSMLRPIQKLANAVRQGVTGTTFDTSLPSASVRPWSSWPFYDSCF